MSGRSLWPTQRGESPEPEAAPAASGVLPSLALATISLHGEGRHGVKERRRLCGAVRVRR
jgi:hypothetical protein